ncbi:hypothetical protein N9093_01910 [bacterium]|jgi:hypothetical protein|nr:hypothetical protein [bacterium]MDB4372878.1 hypothetical protein [Mariniblastus sp.]MDB4380638.1 hypothetical protein [Mariniblastus sp.]MDB4468593.1 hypothetical protein [bacterium]
MSDNQRRAVCRILFLILCAFPTASVGYWIFHPQTAVTWEREIQANLGLTTRIDSVETPGPYTVILRGVEFLNVDGESILETVETRIEFGKQFDRVVIPNKVTGVSDKGIALFIENIRQNIVRKRSIRKRLLIEFKQDLVIKKQLAVEADRLFARTNSFQLNPAVRLGEQIVLSDFRVEFGNSDANHSEAFAAATFKIGKESDVNGFVELEINRKDADGLGFNLNTNGSAIPCWLLKNTFVDLPATLGPDALFKGEVLSQPKASISNVSLQGWFEQVSLAASVSQDAAESASVQLVECEFEGGLLSRWQANLYPNSESAPRPIDGEYLFTYTRNLDIAGAINKAWSDYAAEVEQ